jgi:TonB-dependent starch-binding outer membrane protein SusC
MSKIRFKVCKLLLLGFITLFFCSFDSFGQKVNGTVVDETNAPLPGVSVMLKDTKTAAITDLDGNFEIEVGNIQTDVLVFSFFGMETQELPIAGKTQINVTMAGSATVLGEVVAIGYGTVKKKDITGSVSSVQGKDLALIPVSTAAEALTGKMAGVQVVTTEGSPDAAINIRVRGGGSITQDNSPLYIVDGFPVSSISDIPSSQIQSIDVLKDASSTAIYGARGANGVVIITTKSGVEGKVKVSYNAYAGYKQVANHLNTLSVPDYMKWQYEYALLTTTASTNTIADYEKRFGSYQDIDLYDGQPATNWYDQVFGHIGKTFNQDLSITGGNDKFRYQFGYAGLSSDEIMLGSSYKRNNIDLKLDHKASNKVSLSFQLRYSDTKIYGGGAIEQTNATPTDSKVKYAMIYYPIPGIEGLEEDEPTASMFHPIKSVYDNDKQQFRKRLNMGASFSWKIINDLEFRTEVGLDYFINNSDQFYGMTTYYIKNTPSALYQMKPALESTENKSMGLRNTNTLTYDFKKLFAGSSHSLKLLLGQEVLNTQSNTLFNQVWGFPTTFTSDDAYRLVSQGFSNSYNNTLNPDNNMLSFFGRANYDFKGRYLFSATFRADGSSKFAKDNRWGYFPSAAVAWRVSEENFMKGIDNVVDNLKLRLSYGTAGNNNIPSGQMTQTFNSGTSAWINGFTNFWSASNTMANPDLKWETTTTRNVGLDFGLFKSRISGTAELYYNTTKDLLINFPVSGTGYNSQYRNMGETENKGLEISLTGIVINKENFGLNLGFNIGFNKNKIVSLGIMNDFGQASSWSSTEIGNDYWLAVGSPVGMLYGYKNDGRYEVADFSGYNAATNIWTLNPGVVDDSPIVGALRPGMIKLRDMNEDGLVNTTDNTILGNTNPVSTGGFNIDARVYGFDLSAAFSYSYGNDIYNANKIEYTTGRYSFRNMIDIMADGKRWTNMDANGTLVNDPATLEAMNATTTLWSPRMGNTHIFSSWAVEDASFLRLNTLSIGYTIPGAIVKRIHIDKLRLYVSAYNVFCLTNYTGFDPEVSTRRSTGLTPGVDYSAYPKSKQLLFGLNLSF